MRELAAGKDFLFADLGEPELRGFEDPVKLWELRHQLSNFGPGAVDRMSRYAAIVSDEILDHYTSSGYERERLSTRGGALELLRTQVLLQRFLPPPPAVVLDVGGGPGVYSAWLARLGYEVHLVDFVPLHARMAREQSAEQPDRPIRSAGAADARRLPFREGTADAVLLLEAI